MSRDFKDYYSILGLDMNATQDDIKKQYRFLMFKFHPDQNPDSTQCEEMTKRINEAYDVLGTPERRYAYDKGLKKGKAGGESAENNFRIAVISFLTNKTTISNNDINIFGELAWNFSISIEEAKGILHEEMEKAGVRYCDSNVGSSLSESVGTKWWNSHTLKERRVRVLRRLIFTALMLFVTVQLLHTAFINSSLINTATAIASFSPAAHQKKNVSAVYTRHKIKKSDKTLLEDGYLRYQKECANQQNTGDPAFYCFQDVQDEVGKAYDNQKQNPPIFQAIAYERIMSPFSVDRMTQVRYLRQILFGRKKDFGSFILTALGVLAFAGYISYQSSMYGAKVCAKKIGKAAFLVGSVAVVFYTLFAIIAVLVAIYIIKSSKL